MVTTLCINNGTTFKDHDIILFTVTTTKTDYIGQLINKNDTWRIHVMLYDGWFEARIGHFMIIKSIVEFDD